MGWFICGVVFLGLAIFVPLYTKKKVSTWDYRYRKDKGVCYFEDDKLIINAMGLQKPIGVPINEIDHVVFFYDFKSVKDMKWFLDLSIVKKDGTKTKSIVFTIALGRSPFYPLDPLDVAKELDSHGISCLLTSPGISEPILYKQENENNQT